MMDSKVKRIGVLTSGGDAPGMNAAVRAVVRAAVGRGVECVGIRRGWNGLINSDFIQMDAASVSHIIDKGGTVLYTCLLYTSSATSMPQWSEETAISSPPARACHRASQSS